MYIFPRIVSYIVAVMVSTKTSSVWVVFRGIVRGRGVANDVHSLSSDMCYPSRKTSTLNNYSECGRVSIILSLVCWLLASSTSKGQLNLLLDAFISLSSPLRRRENILDILWIYNLEGTYCHIWVVEMMILALNFDCGYYFLSSFYFQSLFVEIDENQL